MRLRLHLSALLALPAATLTAAERAAFVAGNCNYTALAKLDNPRQDAAEMTRVLTTLGFSVTRADDCKAEDLKSRVHAFATAHPDAKEIIFYFSGHGLQVHGENYLTGTDSILDLTKREAELKRVLTGDDLTRQLEMETRREADRTMYSLTSLAGTLERTGQKSAVRLVILDSCRDNPTGTKSVLSSKGFAKVEAPSGMLIAFAAKEGTTAAQTEAGKPSLYTGELLKVITRPGLTAEQVFKKTRTAVIGVSGGAQEPREYSSLTGDLVFLPGNGGGSESVRPPVDAATVPVTASRARPFTNSLGMEFVPAGTPGVIFCRTETRVRDFRIFARANPAFASAQKEMEGRTLVRDRAGAFQWQAGGHWEDPHFEQSAEHPVVCVSLHHAEAFCAWLTAVEREKGMIGPRDEYRLPADDEWSAAAGTGKYPWGSNWPPSSSAGNYRGVESKTGLTDTPGWTVLEGFNDEHARTAPVGQFGENTFGLHDMGGNVWEWCSSEYRKSMNSAEVRRQIPSLDKERSDDGIPYRVLRGGSWNLMTSANLLSSFRVRDLPAYRNSTIGFRVVLAASGGG